MPDDTAFEPRLGRIRSTRARRGARYLHLVLAATNLARGGPAWSGSGKPAPGARLSRASGVGRVLARRDRLAAFRARRVVVKARIVRLAGNGAKAAVAHLRYLQRDGTTREGSRGLLYGPDRDDADGKAFLERGASDRHQFRFIVAPEDGAQYDELKPLVRRLMQRVEQDLGTPLEWVAVDHYNTGNPHSHIVVRGVDAAGADLVIARDYLAHGMRERAAELVALDLGPREDRAIEHSRRAEIGHERLTGIDRRLLAGMREDGLVFAAASDRFEQSLRAGRLATLARMGLAQDLGGGLWRLQEGMTATLRRMGERGDIVRTMQRALAARGAERALAEQAVYEPDAADARPLVGRLLERGLADELENRHYLLVDATDGRIHYVPVGRGDALEPLPDDALVRIEPRRGGVREVDRTVARIARTNGGRYAIDLHLREDPSASEEFARSHVRRLEALRRAGYATRNPDGSWEIGENHLARAEAYAASQQRARPVSITVLSPQPLEALIACEAATWLDRELVAADPLPLRETGFGAAVRAAQDHRRQWLFEQGLVPAGTAHGAWPEDLLVRLERRELAVVARRLSAELGLAFGEAPLGSRIEGRLLRREQLVSGSYAVIGRARDFVLVPWRAELARHLGKPVAGIVRASGISWTIGRGRGGSGLAGPPE